MLYSARKLRILPLVQAIHLVAVGGMLFMTMPAAYAAVAAVADRSQHYQIAAGSLTQVLNQFAIQSGALFAANASLTDGLQSKGLAGNYTPAQGFNALLLPHGLQVINKNGTYQVIAVAKLKNTEATAPQNEKQSAVENKTGSLPLITLKATKKDGYTSKRSNTATRFDLSLRETPQSVSVIGQQQIQDQQLTTVADVLNQAVGVSIQRYGTEGSNVGGAEFYSRAMQVENFQIDGIPASTYGVASTSDMLGYESVSILRGSAGLLNGAGNPSALVSLKRKHAKAEPLMQASLSASRWDNYRTQLDLSGALNQAKTVRGYVAAGYEQGDSFRSYASKQASSLYGIIDADIGDHSVLSVGIDASHATYDGSGQRSINTIFSNSDKPVMVDRSFNSTARWSNSEETRYNLFANYTTNFDNGWKTVASLNYINRDSDHFFGVAGSWDIFEVDGRRIGNYFAGTDDYSVQQSAFDLYAEGPYQLLGREHQLMLGATISRYKYYTTNEDWYYDEPAFDEPVSEEHAGAYLGGGVDLDTWDGNGFKPARGSTSEGQVSDDTVQRGVYLATRLKPADSLSIILGSRLSSYKLDSRAPWGSYYLQEKNAISPYAGLVFDASQNFSLYVSYTSIFKPQDRKDRNGQYLDPVEGITYEAGLKGAFYDNRLNTSLSVFQADQDNYAIDDEDYIPPPHQDGAYKAIDGVKTRGIEFEVSGEVLPGWNLNAGYAYAKLEDAKGMRQSAEIPLQSVKLFTTYTPALLDKLTVGGGLNWQSKTFSSYYVNLNPALAPAVTQDAYTLLNLFARYQLSSKLQVQVNATNLTDKTYRTAVTQHAYGEPFNIRAAVNYKH